MKDKIITLRPKGISQKQWAILLLELNILKRAWRPYGVDVEISAPGAKKIIEWGTTANVIGFTGLAAGKLSKSFFAFDTQTLTRGRQGIICWGHNL